MLHDANQLRTLTDEELVRIAYIEQDDLTTTSLEKELLKRFEVVAEGAEFGRVSLEEDIDICDLKLLAELPLKFEPIAYLIQVLIDYCCTDPDELRKTLDCVRSLRQALAADKVTTFLSELMDILTKSQEIDL